MCQVIRKTSLAILFSILTISSYGVHIRGGYLTGERVSSSSFTYRFTVVLYRDNGGVPAQLGTFNFGYTSASEVVVNPVSQGFIDGYVDTSGDATEVLVYQVEHTFPSEGTYNVSYFQQNRNPGIRNMFASFNIAFLIQSTFIVNTSVVSNTSPIFPDPLCFIANTGQVYTKSLTAFDPDGDSLSYRLAIPLKGLDKEGNNIPVDNYLLPNAISFGSERSDGQRAIFQVDAVTGQLVFDSTGEIGEYAVAIIVDEWRNGIKIGSVNYDFQLIVIDLPNDNSGRGTCPGKVNDTGIEFTLPAFTYIDYKETFLQDGFIVANADSIAIENELIESGKVEVLVDTISTENGFDFEFSLSISNLTIEDALNGFYVFTITGFKNGESYSESWLLKVDNVASKPNKKPLTEISLYPNPTTNRLIISAKNSLSNAEIVVTNATGQMCYSEKFPLISNQIEIYLPDRIPAGVYFIIIETSDRFGTMKFLKN